MIKRFIDQIRKSSRLQSFEINNSINFDKKSERKTQEYLEKIENEMSKETKDPPKESPKDLRNNFLNDMVITKEVENESSDIEREFISNFNLFSIGGNFDHIILSQEFCEPGTLFTYLKSKSKDKNFSKSCE